MDKAILGDEGKEVRDAKPDAPLQKAGYSSEVKSHMDASSNYQTKVPFCSKPDDRQNAKDDPRPEVPVAPSSDRLHHHLPHAKDDPRPEVPVGPTPDRSQDNLPHAKDDPRPDAPVGSAPGSPQDGLPRAKDDPRPDTPEDKNFTREPDGTLIFRGAGETLTVKPHEPGRIRVKMPNFT